MTAAPEQAGRASDGTAVDAENPWPGLESFRESDAAFFRGRERDAEALLRLVRRERLTVLFGLSGLGKTSLLQAGLFPRLRAEGLLPVHVRLVHGADAPPLRAQLLDAVAAAARAADVDAPPTDRDATPWEHFHRAGVGYWTADNAPATPVLVLDQFEEAFTLGADPACAAETAAFLEELGDLIEGRPPRALRERMERREADGRAYDFGRHLYKIVLSLRADFLGELEPLRARVPSLGGNRFRLAPLSGRAALLVTAAGGDALVAPNVGERIVRLVAGRDERDERDEHAGASLDRLAVDPALLSLFCRELNERRQRDGRDAITADLVAGSRESILTGFYERSVRGLDPRVRAFVEDRLLTSGGYRNSVAQEDALAADGVDRDALDTLVERRLVRREERDGRPWVELTHDVLTGVVRRSKDERAQQRQLALAEHEAQERERALAAARRSVRRSRLVIAIVTGLALVVAVLGGVAWQQRDRVNDALALSEWRAAVQASQANLPVEALAWLASAMRREPDRTPTRALALHLVSDMRPRLLVLETREGVMSAAFSPDGRQILTASSDSTAQRWDARTGAKIGPPLRYTGWSAAFSPDGRQFVTVSGDSMAQLWDARTGAKTGPALRHADDVRSAAFSPDGRQVVTASGDGTAQLWDARTGAKVGPALADRVESAAFSPDGRQVVTVSGATAQGGWAQVWDARTGATVGPALSHRLWVLSAAFSPDGRQVVTASVDNTAQLWDARTGAKVGPALRHADGVNSAAFSPDGQQIVTASDDSTAQVWDARTGTKVGPALRHADGVNSAAFSPDGRHIVTASGDGTAQLWNAHMGANRGPTLRHAGRVTSVAFSPDGRQIVTALDSAAQVWNAATGAKVGLALRHADGVHSAAFSPDGRQVVTASDDSTAQVWDASTGAKIGPALRHADGVESAAFSPDGRQIVTASHTMAQVWNVRTSTKRGPALQHTDDVESAAFSPDGRQIVTASSDNTAQVWDASTGATIGPALRHADRVESAAFSSDGRQIVTTSRTIAQVWDARTGAKVGPALRHADWVQSAAFSPDGRQVVTASSDSTAQLWDARTGAKMGPPLRHLDRVNSAEFSPDGQKIVTASNDGTAQLWPAWTARASDASDLADFAEAVAGSRLDVTTYAVVPLGAAETNRRMRLFRDRAERTRGTTPDSQSLDAFLQWYFGVLGPNTTNTATAR